LSDAVDSVEIRELVSGERDKKQPSLQQLGGFKIIFMLLLIFVLVSSDVFTDNVIGSFPGAVRMRSPTSFGVVLQGVFLVLFYACALQLIKVGAL